MRILICDRNRDNSLLMEVILKDLGHAVYSVEEPGEMPQIVLSAAFDLLIAEPYPWKPEDFRRLSELPMAKKIAWTALSKAHFNSIAGWSNFNRHFQQLSDIGKMLRWILELQRSLNPSVIPPPEALYYSRLLSMN